MADWPPSIGVSDTARYNLVNWPPTDGPSPAATGSAAALPTPCAPVAGAKHSTLSGTWGLDDGSNVAFAYDQPTEQVRARQRFIAAQLVRQGTSLAESVRSGHDTLSDAELAMFCDEYVRAAAARRDQPQGKALYESRFLRVARQ